MKGASQRLREPHTMMSVLNLFGLIAAILSLQATEGEATTISCPNKFVVAGKSMSECWIILERMRRTIAAHKCAALGGTLVEIFSYDDQQAVALFASVRRDANPGQEPFWIGARRPYVFAIFSKFAVPGYSPPLFSWDSGAVTTVNYMNQRVFGKYDECVYTVGMFWYMTKCTTSYRSICKKSKQCPDGTMSMSDTGPCFKYYPSFVTQEYAYNACSNASSTLANLHNDFDSEAMYRLAFPYDKAWIGLETLVFTEGTKKFYWAIPLKSANGTRHKYAFPMADYNKFDDHNWADNSRHYNDSGCYYFWRRLWFNEHCSSYRLPYVCRLPARCPMISVPNGQVSFVGNHSNGYGSEIMIKCNAGYNILGPFRMPCTVINNRTGESRFYNPVYSPKCVKDKPVCKAPVYPGTVVTIHDPILVGKTIKKSYIVGTKFTLKCLAGYTSIGAEKNGTIRSFDTNCIYSHSNSTYWGFVTFSPTIPVNGTCRKLIPLTTTLF